MFSWWSGYYTYYAVVSLLIVSLGLYNYNRDKPSPACLSSLRPCGNHQVETYFTKNRFDGPRSRALQAARVALRSWLLNFWLFLYMFNGFSFLMAHLKDKAIQSRISPGGERHPLAAAAPLMWVLPPHPSLLNRSAYGGVRTSKVKLHWIHHVVQKSSTVVQKLPTESNQLFLPLMPIGTESEPSKNPTRSWTARLLIMMQCTIGMAHATHGLTDQKSGGQLEHAGA